MKYDSLYVMHVYKVNHARLLLSLMKVIKCMHNLMDMWRKRVFVFGCLYWYYHQLPRWQVHCIITMQLVYVCMYAPQWEEGQVMIEATYSTCNSRKIACSGWQIITSIAGT